jgi:hypothetical protein
MEGYGKAERHRRRLHGQEKIALPYWEISPFQKWHSLLGKAGEDG